MPEPPKPAVPYDSGYKLLFSHPKLVADLLTGFVKPAWLDRVDLDTLAPHKASFVTGDLRQRHDDSIWRVRLRDEDTWLYLYILIEFQSRNEHFMAVRIWGYTALLYQDIIRAEKLGPGGKLPPVFPIVLYNGSEPWTGPVEVAELIHAVHPALSPYTPRLSYFLVREHAVPRGFSRRHPDNLVGHLIAIGQCRTVQEVGACLDRLRAHTDTPQDAQIQRSFAIWLSRLLRTRFRNEVVPEYQNLQEVHTMLAERIDQWVQNAENRGIAKGTAEGIAKGTAEGEAKLLHRLLVRKFGPLSKSVQQRIQTAAPAQIEVWSLNILDAKTLDEVFVE